MDFLNDILKEKGTELTSGLVEKLGFSSEQAEAFVPEAARSAFDVIKDKAQDLESADFGNQAESVIQGIDVGALGERVGLDASQVTSGLTAIVPSLLVTLQEKAGALGGLTSLLGGEGAGKALSGLGGVAGKLFGK